METEGGTTAAGASKTLGDFERVFETQDGPVGLLGTAAATGTTFELSDIAVYPIGPPGSLEIGVAGVRAGLADLKEEIARMGYDELVITAIRVSGANPGRRVQIRIQLTGPSR